MPVFTKSFAPNPIAEGATTTLTLTIDNTANPIAVTGLAFTDSLPTGVTVATPNGASTTCGGTLTATPAGSTITLSAGTVGAGASCTVTVDVTSSTAGMYVNTTGNLTSSLGASAPATATLSVVDGVLIPLLSNLGLILLGGLLAFLGWRRLLG